MGPHSACCPLDFIAGAALFLALLLTMTVFFWAGWRSEAAACNPLVSPRQALPEGPVSPGGVQQVSWASVRGNSSGTVRKEPVCREWYSKAQSVLNAGNFRAEAVGSGRTGSRACVSRVHWPFGGCPSSLQESGKLVDSAKEGTKNSVK